MNLTKTGLSSETIDKLLGVFKKHPKILKIILYGSRAKGNFRPGSDIDLTVISDTLSMNELLGIESEIDDLLLPYKIDLSLFSHIEQPDLLDHIQRVGIDFFSNNSKNPGFVE